MPAGFDNVILTMPLSTSTCNRIQHHTWFSIVNLFCDDCVLIWCYIFSVSGIICKIIDLHVCPLRGA